MNPQTATVIITAIAFAFYAFYYWLDHKRPTKKKPQFIIEVKDPYYWNEHIENYSSMNFAERKAAKREHFDHVIAELRAGKSLISEGITIKLID